MYQHPVFADCISSYEDALFVLFGVPFDASSCFRGGSRHAPAALREASYCFETYDHALGIDLVDVPMCDIGDLEPYGGAEEMLSLVYTEMKRHMGEGKIPIMMGGEHTLTIGGVKAACEHYDDVGLLVLDAHLDLRQEYGGIQYSHACTSYQCLKVLPVSRYASIGIRSGSKEEYERVRSMGITYASAQDVHERGIKEVLWGVLDRLECEKVYLSIDADVVDPAYAPAVSTPEPFGLSAEDVRHTIRALAPMVVGMDVMEITPHYDGGQTALLFSRLLRDFIAEKAKSLQSFQHSGRCR
ncbi:MAG: agmatinase [Methermicoccaceae archaeon]